MFWNFNVSNVDLHSYSLIDSRITELNCIVSISDSIDEITETNNEVETENE